MNWGKNDCEKDCECDWFQERRRKKIAEKDRDSRERGQKNERGSIAGHFL
jgi:hypothetical protein